jgi:hypothetical protein
VLPDTLLLEAPKEALGNTVLFGRIGSNELWARPIITAGDAKAPALENQSAVTAHRDEVRMLAKIYNWLTEGFGTSDLKEAKALLDELSA